MLTCGECGYQEAISHHEPGLCLCNHPETLAQHDVFLNGVGYNPRNKPANESDACRHGYHDIWAALGAARLIGFSKERSSVEQFGGNMRDWLFKGDYEHMQHLVDDVIQLEKENKYLRDIVRPNSTEINIPSVWVDTSMADRIAAFEAIPYIAKDNCPFGCGKLVDIGLANDGKREHFCPICTRSFTHKEKSH